MRGITRPCRHSLSPQLRDQWRSHLCGVCITLRDESGHSSRLLTGYDMLIPSVLIEAQMGRAATVTAGPCALRGLRTAQVVPVSHPATRFAAGASLLNGASALDDKVADGDLPAWTPAVGRRVVDRVATGARREGRRLTEESGFDADPFAGAVQAAAEAELTGRTLDDFLAPAGRAGAALFAHTAVVAGRLDNEGALRRAGDAFGRLVHLLDAVDDFQSDAAAGVFNPLAAAAASPSEARDLARHLTTTVRVSLDEVEMVDSGLARELLGSVLERSVERHFKVMAADPPPARPSRASVAATVVALPAVLPAIFGGRRGWRRRPPPPYGYGDPYYGGRRGYGRRGPSCCDILACDCCANLACNDCCGGDDCCCCCL